MTAAVSSSRRRARRWAAPLAAAVLALAGCSVEESTRGGGLVPPQAAAAASPATVVITTALEPPLDVDDSWFDADDSPFDDPLLDTDGVEWLDPDAATTWPAPDRVRDPLAHALHVLEAATPPDGFGEGTLIVEGPQGALLWPIIIADTPEAQRQGLMGVEDFSALGGYAAMAFVYDSDTTGAFWMRDTPLPLQITFFDAAGAYVSTADMEPCMPPTPDAECERYSSDGPYRIAIEHPVDPAFDIGLDDADRVEIIAGDGG
ncbi:DUF192 domain-containing protein [Candidatus Poriferisodalis sp.]|uniref:DUF192 domain-containing protein n=1 Tax=Candidatus Poriferisodalis sp. TaxID=3101277 RepID=UPI003B029562